MPCVAAIQAGAASAAAFWPAAEEGGGNGRHNRGSMALRRCVLPVALLSVSAATVGEAAAGSAAVPPPDRAPDAAAAALDAEAAMRSGEFVTLAASSGFLACPQSLTTQQGLGHCVGIRPLGAAVVDPTAGGADVFVQCKAQAKPPQGQSITYRYPYLNRDTSSGAPVFGAPVVIEPWGRAPAAVDGPEDPMTNLVVWGAAAGQGPYGATFTADTMHLLRLQNGSRWIALDSWKFQSPGWGGLSSVAVAPQAGGGFRVCATLAGGHSTRSMNQDLPHSTWRKPDYFPYAGDGIYRGILALEGVGTFDVSAQGAASSFTTVTRSGWDGGLMGLRIVSMRRTIAGLPQRVLIGGSRTGLLYVIPDNNASAPTPLVDNSTELLFMTSVIEASPISYPRADGNDDLLIGGENGLHFVTVSDDEGSIRLRHAGPVLQQAAQLVTGQTPTVSVADWDADGRKLTRHLSLLAILGTTCMLTDRLCFQIRT